MMKKRFRTHPWYAALLGLILSLMAVGVALAAGNIDSTNRWAWSTNAGWINFAPDNGGVTVYGDHLEGYAWGENIGWIRLGTCTGGSPCTHANTAADNYGVNNDGAGNLFGYAWGTNVGWINFNPANGGVTVDPVTGDFAGYAWGENVGWIHFQNASPAYKVNTTWRSSGPPAGSIDPTHKYAWGTNIGWINFAPYYGGVTVYSDHLEGYAWGENIGWIRLGSYDGGGAHTYGNTSNTDYGVNRDANGNLSGYAWGTNVGWINFSPTHGGVTVDPATGSFDGYAWAENVGWIHFKGTAPAYNVVTAFRSLGPLLPATLPNGTVGTAYNQTLTASGGIAPYTFAVTAGTLPPGLTLSPDGVLSGTPTAAGTFNFTVTATDANGNTGSQDYAITIVKLAPVGGIIVPVNRMELLAPWLGLAAVALASLAALTVALVRRRRR